MESIRRYFDRFLVMNDEHWGNFKHGLATTTYKRGDIILAQGAVEQQLHFLEEGIVRFFVAKNDKEITFDFCFPGNFFSGYSSFLTGAPSRSAIQVLSATATTYSMPKAYLDGLYSDYKDSLILGKVAAEGQFLRKAGREMQLLVNTPEERYQYLLKEQPQLIQHIPLKYLASYIGVSPETLSRIRARIS